MGDIFDVQVAPASSSKRNLAGHCDSNRIAVCSAAAKLDGQVSVRCTQEMSEIAEGLALARSVAAIRQ